MHRERLNPVIRPIATRDAERCDQIILSHPQHFGHEGGRRACARAVREDRGKSAVLNEEVVGFLTVERHFDASAEITWIAVDARWRNHRIGRRLIERLASDLVVDGCRLLLVMTLAASDDRDGSYHDTRAFYRSAGLVAARQLLGYWLETTALLLVRPLVQVEPGTLPRVDS